MNKNKILFWIVIIGLIIIGNMYYRKSEPFTNSQINQQVKAGSNVDYVNMPLNTTYGCKNICGPQNTCAITGEQCSYDLECQGCRPVPKPTHQKVHSLRGQNDAGKLTEGVTPTYSTLTTDIGTQAAFFSYEGIKPPQYFQGVNKWRKAFNLGQELYDKRYAPSSINQPFMPQYPERLTLSGQFKDNGPLAANDYLSKF